MTNLHGWCTVLDRPFPKFCPLLNPLHKDEEKEDGDVDEFEEIGDNNINTKESYIKVLEELVPMEEDDVAKMVANESVVDLSLISHRETLDVKPTEWVVREKELEDLCM